MAINGQRGVALAATVPASSAPTNSIWLDYQSKRPIDISVFSPGTLTAASYKPQFSTDDANWKDLVVDGSTMTIGTGQNLQIRNVAGIGYFRLNGSTTEAASRAFTVYVLNNVAQ